MALVTGTYKRPQRKESKQCTKCGEEQALSEFSPNKLGKNGLSSWCKSCVRERARQRYQEQKVIFSPNAKKCTKCKKTKDINEFNHMCRRCKECIFEDARLRRIKYGNKYKIYKKKWRDNNKDKVRESRVLWLSKNGPRRQKTNKQWKLNNKDRVREQNKLQRYKDKEKRALRQSIRSRGMKSAPKDVVDYILWCKQGQLCSYCWGEGYTHDHIIPLTKGGENTIENIVPACVKCNTSKGAKSVVEWFLFKGSVQS